MSDIIKILDNSGKNSFIIKLQNKRELYARGYSPLKIYAHNNKINNILIDVYFADKNQETFVAYDLQLEATSIFSYGSVLHQNKISFIEGGEIFNINPFSLQIKYFNNLSPILQERIYEKIFLNNARTVNTFAVIQSENKTILFPYLSIGTFFYFPFSHIRRAFFNQEIMLLLQESKNNKSGICKTDCKNGELCLKNTNRKVAKETIELTYLYYCMSISREYFYNAYSFFIKNKIKDPLGDKKYIFSSANFKFPIFKNFRAELRGEYIDANTFLVYQIIDIDFEKLFNKSNLIYRFEGKNKSFALQTKFFKKLKGKRTSISHINPANQQSNQTDIVVNREQISSVNPLAVIKGKAVLRGETIYSKPLHNDFKETDGISLSDAADKNSSYGKASLSVENYIFDFEKAIELLKQKLNLKNEEFNFYQTRKYYAFSFRFRKRNYFLLELKEPNSSTLLFSSDSKLQGDFLVAKVFFIKENPMQSFNKLKQELKKFGIFFHTKQKHTGSGIEEWVNRLIGKLDEFKGME